jgi:hypothetical protein
VLNTIVRTLLLVQRYGITPLKMAGFSTDHVERNENGAADVAGSFHSNGSPLLCYSLIGTEAQPEVQRPILIDGLPNRIGVTGIT